MRKTVLLIVAAGLAQNLFPGVLDDYSQACSEGDTKGCYQLGLAYRDGLEVEQDLAASRQFFQIGCDMGDARACIELKNSAGTKSAQSQAGIGTQEESSGHLKYYTNERFGFTLAYPAKLFVTKRLSDNGDGITLQNDNRSLKLRAYGSFYGDTIREIYHDQMKWAKEAGQKVTYKVLSKNWFVLSGIDGRRNTIFYLKTYFRDGKSTSFRLDYPVEDKVKYNSLISVISKNFKAE
jgi:TPR repeat protein